MKGRRNCEATCPHFRCGQRALQIRSRYTQQYGGQRGNPWDRRVQSDTPPYCNWVGDYCVAAKCNYAFCERRALLPDGSCGLEDREFQRQPRSIEEEARREEMALKTAQMKLLKKTGKFFVE